MVKILTVLVRTISNSQVFLLKICEYIAFANIVSFEQLGSEHNSVGSDLAQHCLLRIIFDLVYNDIILLSQTDLGFAVIWASLSEKMSSGLMWRVRTHFILCIHSGS